MWGAIIGDLAGSIYEYDQTKHIKKIKVEKLIDEKAFYSDDTILTIAIVDAILHNRNYDKYLRLYGKKYTTYKPDFNPYFNTIFSPGFHNWLKGELNGKSIGNGAMMRISSVGYMFDSEQEVITNSKLATIPSHNSDEAINCSKKVALIIFYAKNGLNKFEIMNKLNIKLKYTKFEKFNFTCNTTIDNCLYALFTSNSFEESIKKVISYGGDTDTNACIVGSMAEALFGVDKRLIELAKRKIPNEFVELLEQAYKIIKQKKEIK